MLKHLLTPLSTVGLLLIANIFMTFAWYGHLKFKVAPLPLIILTSWGIAFFEYCFQIPANRLGYGYFSATELKTLQEILTLLVFVIFSTVYLKEPVGWHHFIGFCFIVLGAFFIFHKWQ